MFILLSNHTSPPVGRGTIEPSHAWLKWWWGLFFDTETHYSILSRKCVSPNRHPTLSDATSPSQLGEYKKA